jgi:hypothetical protein
MSDITTIVIGPRSAAGRAGPDVVAAAEAQLVTVAALDAVTGAARAASTPLVWLLDAAAVPSADTLRALAAHADVAAVSVPVDAAGAPVEALLGRFADDDAALMLAEAARRRVPLRHAPLVSLLVERDVVAGLDPPRTGRFGRQAGVEWTARLFARRPGMLVPDSRVRTPEPARAAVLHAVRLARDGVWSRGDLAREVRRGLGGRR